MFASFLPVTAALPVTSANSPLLLDYSTLISNLDIHSPAVLRDHQRASRVSLAGVLHIVTVTGADVEAK